MEGTRVHGGAMIGMSGGAPPPPRLDDAHRLVSGDEDGGKVKMTWGGGAEPPRRPRARPHLVCVRLDTPPLAPSPAREIMRRMTPGAAPARPPPPRKPPDGNARGRSVSAAPIRLTRTSFRRRGRRRTPGAAVPARRSRRGVRECARKPHARGRRASRAPASLGGARARHARRDIYSPPPPPFSRAPAAGAHAAGAPSAAPLPTRWIIMMAPRAAGRRHDVGLDICRPMLDTDVPPRMAAVILSLCHLTPGGCRNLPPRASWRGQPRFSNSPPTFSTARHQPKPHPLSQTSPVPPRASLMNHEPLPLSSRM